MSMTEVAVRKSVTVNAPIGTAFTVFTEGLDTWWPRTHKIGGADLTRAVLEGRQGGRWYEVDADGSQCEWGRVLVWEPPGRAVLSWELDHRFQHNPSVSSEVEIRFIADGAGTRVELEHRRLERLGQADGEALRELIGTPNGWDAVLAHYIAHTSA